MNSGAGLIKVCAKHAFSAIVIVGLLSYLWRHRGDIVADIDVSSGQIGILVLLIAVTWILNSLPMLVFARLMHKSIGFWENLVVLLAGGLANYLPMRIGTVIRMRFFKIRHALDYSTFIGITGVRTLLLVTLSGICGCISLAGLSFSGKEIPMALAIALAMAAIFPLIFVLIAPMLPINRSAYFNDVLRKFGHAYLILRRRPKYFWLMALITVAQFAVLSIRLFVAFQAFGVNVSVWTLLLLGPMATLLTFLSITPGSLGVREWMIGCLSGITELDFKNGVFAGTLDRSIVMALTFIVGPICLYYTLRNTRGPKSPDLADQGKVITPTREPDK